MPKSEQLAPAMCTPPYSFCNSIGCSEAQPQSLLQYNFISMWRHFILSKCRKKIQILIKAIYQKVSLQK
jgi:hypothetical protein